MKRQEFDSNDFVKRLYSSMADIKDNVNKCHIKFSMYQLDMVQRANILKRFLFKEIRYVDFKHRSVRQKIETSRHVAGIQRYETFMKTQQTALYYSSCPVKQLAFPIYISHTIQAGSLQVSYLTRGLLLSQ